MPNCTLYVPARALPPKGRTMKVFALMLSGRMLSLMPSPMREVRACWRAPLAGDICLTTGLVMSGIVECTMKALPEP